jgi:16S rRNA (guanine527-N7)-methyltransferase
MELGVPVGPQGVARLIQYVALLDKWNRVYNLTAVRDAAKAVSVHLLDSLAVIPYLRGTRVLDVGSGAGLPGIPIALARPEIRVTMLDSSHKKAAFLRQALADLQLRNAEIICERAESWRPSQKFDSVISRAFAELPEFVRLTEHLLAPGGLFAAMKGVHPYEEIEKLQREFRVTQVRRLVVPGLEAERHLVLIERS